MLDVTCDNCQEAAQIPRGGTVITWKCPTCGTHNSETLEGVEQEEDDDA